MHFFRVVGSEEPPQYPSKLQQCAIENHCQRDCFLPSVLCYSIMTAVAPDVSMPWPEYVKAAEAFRGVAESDVDQSEVDAGVDFMVSFVGGASPQDSAGFAGNGQANGECFADRP